MENPIKKEVCPTVTESIKNAIIIERDNGFNIDEVKVEISCSRNDYRLEKKVSLVYGS